MRVHISLQTRFMLYLTILIVVILMLILFVIEQRERIAIFEEQKSKGVLRANYIAQLNLYPLSRWDSDGVKKIVEDQIDKSLIYVIFYDRDGKPFVGNDSIIEDNDIYPNSRLEEEVEQEYYFFEERKLIENKSGKIKRILEIEIPIFTEETERRWASIKIGHSLEEMEQENQQTRLMMIIIGFGGLVLGVGGAILLAKRITGPLKKLVGGTVEISKGDFTHKIDIASKDEIGDLARSFNEMSRQLLLTGLKMEAANKKLIQAEKLASIGRMSASIAHEIRNPLTAVKLNIQKILGSEWLDSIGREHLSLTQEGIKQIEIFIKESLNFARVSELNLNKFSVEQVIDESIKMMADSLEMKNIHLEKQYHESTPQLNVDGDKLRQVIMNILRNACEAVDVGGKINIDLSLHEDRSRKSVRVEIFDNGCGIPEKDGENIFEPFFTTKASGIGLGLANARKIVEQHNGSIRVKKREGKGTSFEILLPCEGE